MTTHVLLIEDDDAFAVLVGAMLGASQHDFDVTTVGSLAEGASAYLAHPSDVVLLDLSLPDNPGTSMDGIQSVVAWDPAPFVVVLTSQEDPDLVADSLDNGAHDFLHKPDVDLRTLERIIDVGLLRHRRMVRESAELARIRLDLESMDAYVAGVTHDLRGPLATAEMMAGLLVDRGHDLTAPDHHQITERVRAQIRRAREFADDLLLDARASSERRQSVPLADVVDRGIALATDDPTSVEVGPMDAEVWGRPGAITQVVTNLVANALAFADPADPRVRVTATVEGQSLRLVVDDNGPGIPRDLREEVFVVGVSTREDGTGVGLSLVRRHASAHGGHAWVEDSPDLGGARLVLALPVRVSDHASG